MLRKAGQSLLGCLVTQDVALVSGVWHVSTMLCTDQEPAMVTTQQMMH